MKYIFKQVDNISGHNAETTVEFNADTLPSILEHFEMFLRGSGFHPSGVLDFVDEDECGEWHNEEFETPVHPWTQTLRDDVEWPFPKEKQPESIYDGDLNSPSAGATQPWHGVAPSVAMQWTVDQLMKNPIVENCSVCGISLETMKNQKCWDKFCPKGNDAY
jgi:hypothetical protein